ncbi:MAG: hypothetical protein ACI8R4_004403 [Paracoccaceae bacterium]|jgi:hypothetical protein
MQDGISAIHLPFYTWVSRVGAVGQSAGDIRVKLPAGIVPPKITCRPQRRGRADSPKKRPSTKLGRSPTGRYEDDEKLSAIAFN